MAQKYYAVRRGRQPGIYRTWPETQKQVSGFSGAQYKSFMTEAGAKAFMTTTATGTPKTAQKSATQPTMKVAAIAATVTVYTDGGSRNTGNVAGGHVRSVDKAAWAYRIELPDEAVTGSAGEFGATNNRMEIMAFRNALQRLVDLGQTQTGIQFVLDSQYVLNAITKGWLAGWKRRGWKRSAGPLVNAELWQDVDRLLPQFSHLTYQWTKGHATNQGNVFVDHLLNETMDGMHQEAKRSVKPVKTAPSQSLASDHGSTVQHQSDTDQSVADIARSLQNLPFEDN
ncbi:ribonuclease H family protein [Levilactobacillus fujinensis]|uniref:ribonuclease H n=1 Tax=Levilactobacillus fujinensis TaxID=2486024 RepID=A0ABW1TIJ7_9LACO|nr:ribonuclease H family protein [Levilactobacillus fujinensis]